MRSLATLGLGMGALALGLFVAACSEGGRSSPDVTCEPRCSGGTYCCDVSGVGRCLASCSDVPAGLDSGSPATQDTGTTPSGNCSPTCSSEQRCCGTTCVARDDMNNCGACEAACDPTRANSCGSPLGGGPTQCLCGNFPSCAPGSTCLESGGTYECTNLDTDPDNCGTVGHACPNDETCSGGQCVCGTTGAACSGGTACCGGTCINTDDDPDNCGGCGTVCGANGPTCAGGQCLCGSEPACAAPGTMSLGASCCDGMCQPNNDQSCGACGHVCEDSMCILDPGLLGMGGGGVCCGVGIPGLGGICVEGGFPGGDGGFPSLDSGLIPGP